MWQLALITNLVIALAYAGVSHHIGSHLTRTHQWRANLLATTVAVFFASCSINHAAHSVRLLTQPEWRGIWSWLMVAVDAITALFGVWYFYERFRQPEMSRGGPRSAAYTAAGPTLLTCRPISRSLRARRRSSSPQA